MSTTAEVTLNLNEVIVQCVEQELDKHAQEHPNCPFKILCDLPKLCRDICVVIAHYLWRYQCKGYKTKTAEICCIHRHTVDNYTHFVES